MKKRKELDALVTNGKRLKKSPSGSRSSHELLRGDSDSSDMEDFSVLQPARRSPDRKGGSSGRLCSTCLPLCVFVLMTACTVTTGTLVWLHLGIREEVNLQRNHLQKVEAGNKDTPEALHTIHSHLKTLDFNVSSFGNDIKKVFNDINSLKGEVEKLKDIANSLQESIASAPTIKMLPKDVHSLSESVANIGSQIRGFENTMNQLKEQQTNLQSSYQTVVQDLENAKKDIKELWNATTESQREKTAFGDSSSVPQGAITVLQKNLLNVAEAVDALNTTVSERMKDIDLQVDTTKDSVAALNGTVIQIVHDFHDQQTVVTDLQHFIHDNLTSRIDSLGSASSLPHSANTNNAILNSSQIREQIHDVLDSATREIIYQNLSSSTKQAGNSSSWSILLKKAQQMVIIYLDMLNQLNMSIPMNESSQDQFKKIIGSILSSQLQRYNDSIKKLSESSDHLWEQYGSLKNEQVVMQSTINGTLITLQDLHSIVRKIVNNSSVKLDEGAGSAGKPGGSQDEKVAEALSENPLTPGKLPQNSKKTRRRRRKSPLYTNDMTLHPALDVR